MAKWITASDPRLAQPGYYDNDVGGAYVPGPYEWTQDALGLESWAKIARQLGFQGNIEGQGAQVGFDYEAGMPIYGPGYSEEFANFVAQKKREGYDFVVDADTLDKRTTTLGLRTPSGEVVGQWGAKAAGFGEFLKEFVLPAAGIALGMGGLNSLMGGGAAAAPANALAGIAEGMVPGGLTAAGIPATAAELAAVGAITGGAPLTAADIGGRLGDVLGQASQAPGLEVMDLAPLESTVTNVTTPAAAATDAANAMQLSPVTQLQPITLAGEPYLTAGAGGGASATAATNALAPAAGLSAEALDAALAGAGGGAGAGAAGATGGSAALQALGGSLQAGTTPGALGSAMGSTTAALATGAGAGLTGIPALDKAIDLVTSPAGQAVVGAVGSVAGGVMQADAAEAAADQQAEAARNALQLQREMFNYQKELLDPYRKRGEAALTRLSGALGLEGPAQAQQMLEMDPGYGFRLGEGMKALERMQAARGNMLSGGALKAGQRYAQDYASGEYNNAYNRLANIAGLGQTVGGQLGTAAQQFGTSAGNVMGQEANALAAGRIGRGSAYSGAIQGGLNAFQNYFNRQQEEQLFRDIFGRTAVGG